MSKVGKMQTVVVAVVMAAVSAAPSAAMAGDESVNEVASVAALVEELVTCHDLDGEQYCLHLGFIDIEPGSPEWDAMWRSAESEDISDTGAKPFAESLRELAAMPAAELEKLEAVELERARVAVGKVKLYDYVGLDIPIPAGFFDKYPVMGIEEGSLEAEALRTAAATGEPLDLTGIVEMTAEDIAEEARHLAELGIPAPGTRSVPGAPTSRYLIYSAYREQVEEYYCGPATFQSIDGGDDGGFESQAFWAGLLGTTTDGTAMWQMIADINTYTNWDQLVGPYVETSTIGKSASWYFDAHQINIGLSGAIVVEHVRLELPYYPYLARSHSGHFQTGRGYSTTSNTISVFEPYDEQDWPGGGNATGKVQYVPYTNVYNANQHYADHGDTIHMDIGV